MMIELQTLKESACDDLELAVDLLTLFHEQVCEEMAGLADAVCKGDAGRAAAIAHKLVGSAVACGFVGLSQELRSMELRCLQDMPDDIDRRMARLHRLLEKGFVDMNALIAGGES